MEANKRGEPMLGIMRLEHYDDADVYRVACSCGDYNHDVTTWIEAKPESDIREIGLTFFVQGRSPSWRAGWNRWRAVWNLLRHGYHENEHTLLMSREAAENLASAILSSIQRLDDTSKTVDSATKIS